MTGNNTFDFTYMDSLLEGSASRKKHAVLSFYTHWPYRLPLHLPSHLYGLVPILPTNEAMGDSPDYGSPYLLQAADQFISALGNRYDGDKRILAIHISLVGFW